MAEGKKRTMTGFVQSDKMNKTVVVEVQRRVQERRYKKIFYEVPDIKPTMKITTARPATWLRLRSRCPFQKASVGS
jgi:ribosomal protein S17